MKCAAIFFLCAPLLLTGCSGLTDGDAAAEAYLNRGWAGYAPEKPADPLYCYKTIGAIDCYRLPQVGERSRLVGKYVPKPKDVRAHRHESHH